MAVPDTLIELLSFSKPELIELGEALNLTTPRGEKFEIASALAEQISLTQLRAAAGEHLGAGRASLSWVLLQPADGDGDGDGREATADDRVELTSAALTIEEVTKALRKLTGKQNPFNTQIRPSKVTGEPVLVNAQHDKDSDLVFFTLANQRGDRPVIKDFVAKRHPEDHFFHVVLRLSRGAMEIRAESRLAKKVTKGWITDFAEELDRTPLRLHVTQLDVDDMYRVLEARTDRHEARIEDEKKGYGKQVVNASTANPDLKKLKRFADDFEDSDPVSSDLVFDYTDGQGVVHEVRVRISPRAGTVRCLNHVSNEVMQHLYDTLRDVRAERNNGSSDNSNPK